MEQNEQAAPDFSSVLNGILSNPEMLSMISSMADKLKGEGSTPVPEPEAAPVLMPQGSIEAPQPQAVDAGKKIADMAGLIAPLLSAEAGGGNDNRACLLRALKPYLSAGRGEAVDYIIKFSRISDVLKNLS